MAHAKTTAQVDFLESLAEAKRVDIVDVVGRYLALKKRGRLWHGLCPFHADRNPSFQVDPQRGRWRCWPCDMGGDVVDFVQAIEKLDVKQAVARLLGAPTASRRRPEVDRAIEFARPESSRAEPNRNRERAQEIWRQTVEIPPDGIARDYLTDRRGIVDWDPDTVRWHPRCDWLTGKVGCIVCPVTSHQTGLTVAIWRIRPSMTEPMGDRRLALGPVKHSACQLFWPDYGDELAIAEGIENALAFHQQHGVPTWSALNAGNMGDLILPRRLGAIELRRIVVVQDNDIDGPGPKAAQTLAKRLRSEGREVRIVGSNHGKDANDALLQRRAS